LNKLYKDKKFFTYLDHNLFLPTRAHNHSNNHPGYYGNHAHAHTGWRCIHQHLKLKKNYNRILLMRFR